MKATELRFGVWVTDTYANGERYETQVTIKQLEYPHNCEGIPLSEEWLLKSGFEQYTPSYFQRGDISVDGSFRDYVLVIIGNAESFKIKIKYVHQLQNLYFALIGEELTIK